MLLLFSTDEETCVFKCSVSRETECSRVGKQSFIITLGCNSVLLQFASPAGKVHLLLQVHQFTETFRQAQLQSLIVYKLISGAMKHVIS